MATTALQTITGPPVEIAIESVTRATRDGIGYRAGVHARVHISWPSWQRVMELGAFHLDGVDQPAGFEPDQDVTLTLQLRAPFMSAAPDQGDALSAALADPHSPLSHTESWRCTEVLQSVDAPEGHAELGVRTPWASPIGPENLVATGDIVTLVTGYLTGLGHDYEIHDSDLIRFTARADPERAWLVLITLDRTTSAGTIFSVHPHHVPVAARPGIALLLLEANHQLGAGSFEIDENDGEVRYRLAFARPTLATLKDRLDLNLTAMATYYDAIRSPSR